MTVIRIKHKNHYTVIQNSTLRDRNLSWKARGILCFLLSYPDDWEISISHLEYQSPDGRESVRSGLKELEREGYLTREKTRNQGKFCTNYIIHELPHREETAADSNPSKSSNSHAHRNGFSDAVQPTRVNRRGSAESVNHPLRSNLNEVTSSELTFNEVTLSLSEGEREKFLRFVERKIDSFKEPIVMRQRFKEKYASDLLEEYKSIYHSPALNETGSKQIQNAPARSTDNSSNTEDELTPQEIEALQAEGELDLESAQIKPEGFHFYLSLEDYLDDHFDLSEALESDRQTWENYQKVKKTQTGFGRLGDLIGL